jgi:hypothetical protein
VVLDGPKKVLKPLGILWLAIPVMDHEFKGRRLRWRRLWCWLRLRWFRRGWLRFWFW